MKTGIFVGGKFVDTGSKIVSISPSTEEPISEVSIAEGKFIEEALNYAWESRKKKVEKSKFIKLKEILTEHVEEISELIAIEQGKPIAEAITAEIYPSLSAIDFLLEKGEQILEAREMVPHEPLFKNRESRLFLEPYGILFLISPSNYPFVIPFINIIMAVYTGMPVIFRPSKLTPLIGLKIGELFQEAGFPEHVLQILITEHDDVERILRDRRVSTVIFTGSVSVGRRIAQIAGESLKKPILELGGNDVMLVLEDANIQRAAAGAVWGAFMNAGQTCASIERILVHKNLKEKLVSLMKEKMSMLKVGNPLEADTDLGPLVSKQQKEKVMKHMKEAEKRGAMKIVSQTPIPEKGYFLAPHIFLDVPVNTKIWEEETFGPVVAIKEFENEEEAIELANSSNYALTSSIWTENKKRAWEIAQKLEVGTVTINDHISSFVEPSAPWGGFKWSGIGRVHGEAGLREFLQIKYVMGDFSKRKTLFWWFNYSKKKVEILNATLKFIYGRGKLKAGLKLLPHIPRLAKELGIFNLFSTIGKLFGI